MIPTYNLGTVSVSNGSTTVTGDGVIWSGVNARSGDTIWIDGAQNQISDVTDDTHLELILPASADKTNVSYVIVQDSPLRYVGAQPMVDVSFLIGVLNSKGLLWYLPAGYTKPSDVTPALTADDGQGILKIDTGALWVMQGGSWVAAGTYKGFQYKGAYDSGTTYAVNDVITNDGSAYIVTASTTGNAPPNASYYDVFASKGDKGATGATGADATIAVGTVTGVDYGQPATVTNVGTSGAAVFNFEIPKGQDGTGTGDVVGPASATDAAVVGFDGTTGKLVKELSAAEVRAAAGGLVSSLNGQTGALSAVILPQNRLTLTSGVAEPQTDVVGAASVYLSEGQSLTCDGANLVPDIAAEITLALDSNSGHAGYHQSGKGFLIFRINDSGTIRIGTGPAMISNGVIGTGAGTSEIVEFGDTGVWVNANAIDIRYGTLSGDVAASVPANEAICLGRVDKVDSQIN
jgi:hypothetical protein